eukprot:695141-Prymnesium_polylepis.1
MAVGLAVPRSPRHHARPLSLLVVHRPRLCRRRRAAGGHARQASRRAAYLRALHRAAARARKALPHVRQMRPPARPPLPVAGQLRRAAWLGGARVRHRAADRRTSRGHARRRAAPPAVGVVVPGGPGLLRPLHAALSRCRHPLRLPDHAGAARRNDVGKPPPRKGAIHAHPAAGARRCRRPRRRLPTLGVRLCASGARCSRRRVRVARAPWQINEAQGLKAGVRLYDEGPARNVLIFCKCASPDKTSSAHKRSVVIQPPPAV